MLTSIHSSAMRRHRTWQTSLVPTWLVLLVTVPGRANAGPYDILDRFADVLVYIEESYVDPVERTRLLEGATAGMVSELDPHSAYLTPAQFAQFIEDTQGAFAGLGVEVDFREDRVTVIATMPDSPAERAGILAGDRIVAVDSVPITGVRADTIIRRMRGAVGTKVRLTLRRDGKPDPISVTVTRAIVSVPSVEGKLLDASIGYVRLKSFQEGSYVELVEQLARLSGRQQLRGLILDLRGNPGGLVSEAIAIADEFLDRGTIYSARHRGQVVETITSSNGDLLERMPLLVLVGAGTASSAEIVTGALQDRGRALVVGEPTFGKGSVQNVIELPGGAGLLLTTLRYFTPKGRAIQARGLMPDVLVKSADAKGAVREADIAGHLHTEGAPTEAKAEMAANAPTDTADQPARPPAERVPLQRIPANPATGDDPVLAKGYELLLGQITKH
jgi:carboxyl-terminal processing protease